MKTSIAFALVLVFAASPLACDKSASADKSPSGAPSAGAGKTIGIVADDKGYTPAEVTIKKGEKTTLVFTRTSDSTCAKEVVFPDLKIEKPLPLNKPVSIDIPVDTARTLTFQCGMGMYKSKVVIQ